MIFLGIISLGLGWFLEIDWLWASGVVLMVIGAVFWLLGKVGQPVGGRRNWF